MAAFVTLVNRSSKPLLGVWDGRHYDIAPGKHSFPEVQAVKFKEQNPVMGSENPFTLEKEYLIGIEDYGDPITPLEQTDAKELMNFQRNAPTTLLKGGGLYADERHATLPLNSGFVKP